MYYALTGPADAPVVVLLHGLGSSGDDWPHQADALKAYRVLTVDLPGHHRSARPAGGLSIPAMVEALDGLLARLAIDRAHVVGLSLGGCVALALVLHAPARVQSLVVINAFARLRPAGLRALARGVGRVLLALGAPMHVVAAYVARDAFPRPEHAHLRSAVTARLAANVRGHYLGCMGALMRFDVRHRLGEIRCPTLIVAGADDTTVPLAAKELLATAIPRARLHVVLDSGHVTPSDRPAALNGLLVAHFRAAETDAGA